MDLKEIILKESEKEIAAAHEAVNFGALVEECLSKGEMHKATACLYGAHQKAYDLLDKVMRWASENRWVVVGTFDAQDRPISGWGKMEVGKEQLSYAGLPDSELYELFKSQSE